ncbi:HEPN domain-containing protein [Pseudomonas sp. MDMC216]|nr:MULTISPECIES: HEPN domain-containing protein [unclassified Pseudomonas]MDI5993450.1 HEPN domain-containing protein [Pseudomonas sp. MDMC216]MDI6008909.1 HEPN domain-containing protein [Pseudomonas sp. MDMC17]
MDKFQAIRFYGLCLNFWQLTLNASSELIKAGNSSSMSYEGWHWPSDEEFEEHTKWSDSNIAEPVLFNFYHGIELSLKSLILAKGNEIEKNHKLTELLQAVSELYQSEELLCFYGKYIHLDKSPLVIQEFCKASDITMDFYFQSLKYPVSTKGEDFDLSLLRAREHHGIAFFQELYNDIKSARKLLNKIVSTECNDVV